MNRSLDPSRRLAAPLLATLLAALPAAAQDAKPVSPAPSAAAPAAPAPYSVGAPQVARRKVSLREALELAARQGPDVAAARAQAAVAQAGVRKAWSAWKPELTATGTFDHTSAPSSLDFGAIALGLGQVFGIPVDPAKAANAPKTTIVAENSYYGQLQLSQPLFSPQGLFLPGIAGTFAEAAQRGADEAREQVLLGTAKAFLSLQGLDQLLKAAQDAERVSLKREDDARAQIRAGTAVELSLLRAQAETAAARVQIANLEGVREGLFPLLEGLVGEAIEPSAPGGGPSELPNAGEPASDPWERSFGVQAAVQQVKAVEKSVDFDNFQWLPSVAAILKGNYNSNGGFANTNTTWDFIVAASVPLYDRGVRYAQRAEDLAKLKQALAGLAAARAKARSAWLGARANLGAAEAALQQALAQEALAVRVQEQIGASSKAGLATTLDVIDADNRRFGAASAVVQARTNVEVRRAELMANEGRLFASLSKQ